MTEYKEVQVPATTKKVPVRVLCDRCGEEVQEPDRFRYRRFEVSAEWGESYPGDSYPTEQFSLEDCCDPCLRNLKGVLEAAGYKLKTREWE